MIDKEMQAYHTYRDFLQTLLTICGCWYMPPKSGTKSTYYWSVCIFFLMIIFTIITLHVSYINRHNLMTMMKFIGVATSAVSAVLKVGTFMINRGFLINCHRTLHDLFEEELMRNEKIQKIMLSSLRRIYCLAYTYSTVLAALLSAYFMPQYLFIIRDLRHLPTNYTLPVSRSYGYFWPVPDNFLYHLHLFFETVLVIFSSIIACSVENIFGFYVCQISSMMNAMTFRLTNPLPTEIFSDLLKTCVAKHQKLLECRKILEHTYRFIVFWHVITNAMLLCALIYEVTLSEINVVNLASFVTYAVTKLLQTFTYAWYGTILTNAGENFRKGIYFGEWPNSGLDRHVRTNIIFMMMQKPMIINIFFFPIDIVLFTNFMNATMSYFFLLQSVSNVDE